LLEELGRADAAACEDTRRSRTLLDRHGITLPLVSLHEHNERAQTAALLRRIEAGERICLLSDAGTPAVSDPGARLVESAIARGLPVEVLPGPSAVTTALVASGFSGGGFVFAGFLPRAAGALAELIDRLDATGLAVVAFESPKRLPATLERLAERDPDRPAAVCRELTKLHEQVERATLRALAERFRRPPPGEVTLVLAPARPAEPPLPDAATLAELAAALGAKRAAVLVAELTGVPRNRVYAAISERRA
jgi:16S rRNA (cytidine1402-2'-O)-methyltransferase